MKYTQRYDTVKGRGHRVVIQRMILPRPGQIYFRSVSSVRALSMAPEVPFPFRLPLSEREWSGWKVRWMAFVTRRGSVGGFQEAIVEAMCNAVVMQFKSPRSNCIHWSHLSCGTQKIVYDSYDSFCSVPLSPHSSSESLFLVVRLSLARPCKRIPPPLLLPPDPPTRPLFGDGRAHGDFPDGRRLYSVRERQLPSLGRGLILRCEGGGGGRRRGRGGRGKGRKSLTGGKIFSPSGLSKKEKGEENKVDALVHSLRIDAF